MTESPALQPSPVSTATAELFRERRAGLVDTLWYLSFVFGFALSAILAFKPLTERITLTPAESIGIYLVILCLSGLACGVIGAGIGHLLSTLREKRDLRLHPRRFET